MFVVLIVDVVAVPIGQGEGDGSAPRFCAPEQGSLAGGGPPAHGPPQGGGALQEMTAAQPVAVTLASEVKRIVIHPDDAVTIPGELVPV